VPSISLQFVSPDNDNLAALKIWEAPSQDGPFDVIETVTDIGIWPNYIDEYTSANVVNPISDWFAISWVDDKGAETEISAAIQGGTSTAVWKLVQRLLQREPSIDERVAVQVAEYVISVAKHTEDPYDPTLTFTYRQWEGMTLLAQARAAIQSFASGESESYTAGLVSQKSTSGGTDKDKITWLLQQANALLGISMNWIMLLEDVDPMGLGTVSTIGIDQSRLLLSIE
jgi:hypothetical protein